MSLTNSQKADIQELIKSCLRKKFKSYKRETDYMPFHDFLLGKERMEYYSLLQSLNTSFGRSIYEPVAVDLAKANFRKAVAQYKLPSEISEDAQNEIQLIINEIAAGKVSDKSKEIERIRAVCQSGKMIKIKIPDVDLYMEDLSGEIYLFDLKSPKPNRSDFQNFKIMLLKWIAAYLATNPSAQVNSYLALPYNPYHPKPYNRWTLVKGTFDLSKDAIIADEFWNFIGKSNIYDDLLVCFELVGIEMKEEIDAYFEQFKL